MKTKQIIGLLILAVGLSSCVVSKKKYEALNMAKQASDRKVRSLLKNKKELEQSLENKETAINSLQGKMRTLKEEFNNLKYDMSASNAKKSSEIDKLTKKLGHTLKDKKNIIEKSAELEGDLNWLRKEKQRQAELISEMEANIKTLENKIETLEATKAANTTTLETTKVKIEDLTSEINALKERLKREQETNAKLQKQLSSGAKTSEEAIPEV